MKAASNDSFIRCLYELKEKSIKYSKSDALLIYGTKEAMPCREKDDSIYILQKASQKLILSL